MNMSKFIQICKKNIFRLYFAAVLYNFVQYGTVQYRVPCPLTKVKFFSLHFWMNQAISNVFPRVLEKTQKNQKKSLDLTETPPPGLENFQTFLGFFFEGFPKEVSCKIHFSTLVYLKFCFSHSL